MKIEVMLSGMNIKKENLDKTNIKCKCTVINQCKKNEFKKYKNFNIYSFNEIGTSNSRNKALKYITEDIILIGDDDIIYSETFEKDIINEFKKNKKADMIMFNIENPFRKKRINKTRKKIHFYNCLNYGAANIAFKRKKLNNIKFNTMFGPNAKYKCGEDSLFIMDFVKNKAKIYTSPIFIGKIINNNSTWFKGYNEKYFYDKGALFTAISKKYRKILMLQFLIRHKEFLTNYKIKEAYKIMKKGSEQYLKEKKEIKVLQITGGTACRGIEKQQIEWLENINEDIKFDFISPSKETYKKYKKEIEEKNSNIYDTNIKNNNHINKLKYIFRLYKFLKKKKYDIVHINTSSFSLSFSYVLMSKLTHQKKIIVHSHNDNYKKIKKHKKLIFILLNPLYNKMIDKIISCSKITTKSLLKEKYINKKNIILKNGLKIDDYKFNEKIRNEYIKKYKLENKIIYGNVAAFDENKNHNYLIDLFYKIQKKQNSILILIGEGKLEETIKQKVKKLNIEDKVIFLGYQKEVNKILNCIDIFILPSYSEGLGKVAIEAQTNGAITYCSDGVPKETNISPQYRKFNLNDKKEITIKKILKEKPDINKRKEAYKYTIKNGYDIKDVTNKLEKIYKELINERNE